VRYMVVESDGSLSLASGSWLLRPRGLTLLGNQSSALPGNFPANLSQDPPPTNGLHNVLAGGQSHRLIHPEEVSLVATSLTSSKMQGNEWLPLGYPGDGISIMRRADEPLSGAITVKVEAKLTGIPIEVSCMQCSNFSVRCFWTKLFVISNVMMTGVVHQLMGMVSSTSRYMCQR